MSGAEIIGLISGIIAIIDASIKVCNAAADPSSLSSGFRDVATRLPLIQETLMTAMDGLAGDSQPSKSSLALKGVLEGCKQKTMRLEDLLRAEILPAGTGTWKRVEKALRTVPKEGKVEHLMDAIIADLQVLTFSHAIKTATREDVEALIQAAAEGRDAGKERSGTSFMTFQNSGSGLQIAHSSSGNMNFNTGTGSQVNFESAMAGAFYFGIPREIAEKPVR